MRHDSRFIVKDQWVQEVPLGSIDGSNKMFRLSQAPRDGACVMLFLNGLFTPQVTGYTIYGSTINFINPPARNSSINAVYIKKK